MALVYQLGRGSATGRAGHSRRDPITTSSLRITRAHAELLHVAAGPQELIDLRLDRRARAHRAVGVVVVRRDVADRDRPIALIGLDERRAVERRRELGNIVV